MFETLNMSLTAWDLPTDPYDHDQLAGNFVQIDQHDHSTGKGVQIPSGGLKDRSVTEIKIALDAVGTPELQDNSVTQPKLADNAVGSDEIINGAVGTSEIADGAVTAAKIDPNFLPVGSIIMWGRPDALPSGSWEICDGRPWASVSNTMGYSSGNMPNLVNRFPLGAATTGTGTAPTDPPAIGQVGSAHTIDLTHTHTTPDHTHTVPAHTHSISVDGIHSHSFEVSVGVTAHARTREVGIPTASGFRQALFIPGASAPTGQSLEVPLTDGGGHSHGGSTGSGGGGSTGAAGAAATGGASANLSAVDKRPRYTGVLFIMRVR